MGEGGVGLFEHLATGKVSSTIRKLKPHEPEYGS